MVGSKPLVIEDSFQKAMCFGTGDVKENRSFLSTSHGVQITPEFFVGGGVAVNYWWDSESWSFPLFVDTRVEFHKACVRISLHTLAQKSVIV